jgi:DUF177 domain-containing protein
MLLDLARFRGNVDHIDRRFEPAEVGLRDEEFRLVSPADLSLDVRKDATKVRLVGTLRAELECDCSRCLDPLRIPVDARFDLLFLPEGEAEAGGEHEVGEGDTGVSLYRNDEIDLNEVMREQFYLALPMKPLCREDCKGLCPVCGVNRNQEMCQCQHAWEDPRLAPLRNLKN